jgi:pimeloyl-ACP methyl ester carboxylesterase
MRRHLIPAAAVLALVVSGCADGDGGGEAGQLATTTTTTAASGGQAAFEDAPCPMEVPSTVTIEITCGYLTVPENRDDPESRDIRLAVARLHSPSPDPAPDPVVELSGGPGFPSLVEVEGWAESALLERGDVILFDQRGLGFSEPNLDCPETNEAVWQVFGTNDEPEAEGEVLLDSVEACRERLVAEGVDLEGYDTIQSAADVADLRVAMGFEEWNLRGVSYGSALAQMILRNHPEGIRAVLLDSVVPPDVPFDAVARGESARRAFDALDEACGADPACGPVYGEMDALFAEAAATLDANPREVVIPDPETGVDRVVHIDGGDLMAGLFNAMYDQSLIPVLPGAVRAIADGNGALIDALAPGGIAFLADQHEAMTASVVCADWGRLSDPRAFQPFVQEHPELAMLLYFGASELICDRWGVAQNPAATNQLLTDDEVDVPVLVLAGRFDPVTPPGGSRRVAEALGLELVLLPNAGHGGVGDECGRAIWLAFLDDPATPPDTSCVDATPPITFG